MQLPKTAVALCPLVLESISIWTYTFMKLSPASPVRLEQPRREVEPAMQISQERLNRPSRQPTKIHIWRGDMRSRLGVGADRGVGGTSEIKQNVYRVGEVRVVV